MIHKIKYTLLLLVVVLFTRCEVEHKDFKPSSGEVDFSTFVALGDSYTAGYTDGALGSRGQQSSFPNIIAGQLASVGNKGFTQPWVRLDGSVGSTGAGYLQLKIVDQGMAPVPNPGNIDIFAERVYDASTPINNLGVPGAKSFHLLATVVNADPLTYYSQANPFFSRFASSMNTSVLADALAQNPTFVSLWIGGNDVLTYALAGGEADSITNPNMFANYMGAIAAQLFRGSTLGVIANVPDIEALPYFDAIPYDALEIDQATADLLNAGYAQYNAGSEAMGLAKIEFVKGKNALVIADDDYAHPGKIRQIKNGEKVLLPALSNIRDTEVGWGSKMPIPEEYVLDADDVADIDAATEAYNQTIKSIANQYGLAFVDLNALMQEAGTTGLLLDGHTYTSTFISGGIFSLDGIHATARGSAIIANAFIKAINKQYNTNIPQAAINSYETVSYP
ncbi:GDSL-like Lipase/Acylhydrolase family protein [Saccharicrinis carchari]|uniref:GDSL-like Lipase/Acylhydrolase family protein n=1 Tax=Saccharicrinis carchari TaxID=1168039 RepID=A0A521B6Y0_SACCC|nr:SGNH/GDSL hydrolase family protein [Saccharicrinis carchari]SMO42833.1 GDSL-like Lipase/Acylhydrolase family protein [Saccharicrinis carchari]